MTKEVITLRQLTLEGLRILYVGSECLFYLLAFETDMHDELVKKTNSWRHEEVLQDICDALIKRNDSYNALLNFFTKEADGETHILGISSQKEITRELLASHILNDIECLNKPLTIISDSLPEDFI